MFAKRALRQAFLKDGNIFASKTVTVSVKISRDRLNFSRGMLEFFVEPGGKFAVALSAKVERHAVFHDFAGLEGGRWAVSVRFYFTPRQLFLPSANRKLRIVNYFVVSDVFVIVFVFFFVFFKFFFLDTRTAVRDAVPSFPAHTAKR